jgi:hypothetical protein
MRPDVVVVGDEAVDRPLELLLGLDVLLGRDELLERLVEAFDLAAGLGVIGPRMLDRDAQGEELLFDEAFDTEAGACREDQPVEFLRDVKRLRL